jgi:apolipoprotein N-acyltransferase
LVFILIGTGYFSFQLIQLAQHQKLWESNSLGLFLCLWLLSQLLVYKKRQNAGQDWVRLQNLSAIGGVTFGLSFPGWINFPPLAFFCFLPFLLIESESEKISPKGPSLFKFLYPGIVLGNIISTSWVANASFVAALFAILVNGLLMLLPWLANRLVRRRWPELGFWPLIPFWLTFEFLHYRWELSWPWLTLGNALAPWPAFIQWYEWTGVLGGSVWVLALNILVFQWIQKKRSSQVVWVLALVFSLPVAWSLIRFYNYEEQGTWRKVTLVQPNFEPNYEKPQLPEGYQTAQILELLNQHITDSTAFVLFPESSFGFFNLDELGSQASILELRGVQARFPKTVFISGIDAYRLLTKAAADRPTTRRQTTQDGREIYYETMNAAAQLNPANTWVSLYFKSKLVPGAEIFPYPGLLGFLKPVVEQFGGTLAGFVRQDAPTLFASPQGKAAPVICYESVYGDYCATYVRLGAQAIFILTNDGWWGHTPGHRQHLQYARLRAIENRRYVARAASTGISAFIDPRGVIQQRSKYGEKTAMDGKIQLLNNLTLYSRWGDWVGKTMVALTLLLGALALGRPWFYSKNK